MINIRWDVHLSGVNTQSLVELAKVPNLYSAHEYLVFMAAYMAARSHIVQKKAKIPSINGENAMYSYVLPIGYFMSYCM